MVATHIFHKLVTNARLFIKKASLGCFISVFDSSGEPAGRQNSVIPPLRDVPGRSSRLGASRHARMLLAPQYMLPWINNQVCIVISCCIRGDLGQFHLCSFSGPKEFPAVAFGEGDISTEAETLRQTRSRSAKISRRLVSLARSASASIDFSGRDHSQVLLEQAFDDGMYRLK